MRARRYVGNEDRLRQMTEREYRFIVSTDKRSMFSTAVALRCQWCQGPGFTSDIYFCSDICREQARTIVELTARRFGIDWDYIGASWRAHAYRRP